MLSESSFVYPFVETNSGCNVKRCVFIGIIERKSLKGIGQPNKCIMESLGIVQKHNTQNQFCFWKNELR